MSCCFEAGIRDWGIENRKRGSRALDLCVGDEMSARLLCRFPIPHSPFPAAERDAARGGAR